MPGKRSQIVTFKADPSIVEALSGVRNRSEFIRNALLAAMENGCPLCRGTGILTPEQRRHWEAFAVDHVVSTCKSCDAPHLTCRNHGDYRVRHARGGN